MCVCGRALYLSEAHAVPLVGSLLRLGSVHQLAAGLVLLMEVRILAPAPELRRVLVCQNTPVIQPVNTPLTRLRTNSGWSSYNMFLTCVSLILVSCSGPVSDLHK